MMQSIDRYRREADFLRMKPGPDVSPLGTGIVKFHAIAKHGQDARIILDRVKSVLSVVDETAMTGAWPEDSVWSKRMPKWFSSACAPIMTEQQANAWLIKWKKMSPSDRVKAEEEKPWAIDSWLHWMQPENRQWYWWDSEIIDESSFIVATEVEIWPFPWGSLRWLLRAAGTNNVESI